MLQSHSIPTPCFIPTRYRPIPCWLDKYKTVCVLYQLQLHSILGSYKVQVIWSVHETCLRGSGLTSLPPSDWLCGGDRISDRSGRTPCYSIISESAWSNGTHQEWRWPVYHLIVLLCTLSAEPHDISGLHCQQTTLVRYQFLVANYPTWNFPQLALSTRKFNLWELSASAREIIFTDSLISSNLFSQDTSSLSTSR